MLIPMQSLFNHLRAYSAYVQLISDSIIEVLLAY